LPIISVEISSNELEGSEAEVFGDIISGVVAWYLDWKCLNQPRSPFTLPGVSSNPDEGDPALQPVALVLSLINWSRSRFWMPCISISQNVTHC